MWSIPGLVVFRNDRIVTGRSVVKPGRVQIIRGRKVLGVHSGLAHLAWTLFPPSKRIENSEDAADLSIADADVTVLIVRDFYNNMASRLKWERDIRNKYRESNLQESETRLQMNLAKDLWVKHAELAASNCDLASWRVCLYDKWVSDPGYRASLAERLDVRGSSAAIKKTATYGPGSSFDGMTGTPHTKKLVSRFEQFSEDSLFLELCRDDRILTLNRVLFGDTPSSDWASRL